MHSVPGTSIGKLDQPTSDGSATRCFGTAIEAELTRLATRQLAMVASLAVPGALDLLVEVFSGEPLVLCHGDVHAGNWKTDPPGAPWLVDWKAARYQVRASDFNQCHWQWMTPRPESLLVHRHPACHTFVTWQDCWELVRTQQSR